jgi:hypothetical protein
MHAADDVHGAELAMSELAVDERLGDDPDCFAATLEDGIRKDTHEADVSRAEDQADAALGESSAEAAGLFGKDGGAAHTRAAENTEPLHEVLVEYCKASRTG